MRVDGPSNIQAALRTNVADLMNRLETGDVIRAKVLEITSNEVMLRLFDGTVLKAAAGEDLQAKVGQTLNLTVTSKSEGTLYLETVKDQLQGSLIKTDLLKSMLAALNLKPSAQNLELAAEFLKAGISPTAEQFQKASGFMKEFNGLNAEKALFLAVREIQADPEKLELLIRLLDGKLKLGEQLKNLQTSLENAAGSGGKPASANSLPNVYPDAAAAALAKKASATGGTPADKSGAPNSSAAVLNQSQQLNTMNGLQNKGTVPAGQPAANLSKAIAPDFPDSAAEAANKTGAANTAGMSAALKGTGSGTKGSAVQSTVTPPAAADAGNASELRQGAAADGISPGEDRQGKPVPGTSYGYIAAQKAVASAENAITKGAGLPDALAEEGPGSTNKPGSPTADSFSKVKEALKEIFLQLDPEQSAKGLELSKTHRELNDKLDLLRAAMQNSGLTRLSGGDGITAAANLVDDSAKLLNQLNGSSILYYQLPVHLAGQNTTAELYIMKRERNKKKIDPHNSVLFVSLDTNNMGRFETLIDVKGNNVTINFRTERQEINNFVKENIKTLYSGLSECGYKLADIRYALIDAATPPVRLEQLLSGMAGSNHSKVDMRI